ncbi:MAG: hypothetical protein MRY78_00090 [Saprospiraceae bacterium]|nr:hypothetical protein [Saprospiraceae bacterium]
MENLIRTICSTIPVSEASVEAFAQIGLFKQVVKNTIINRPSQSRVRMFFLESGIFRSYRLIDGVDYTHHFFTEHWFASDYQSYLLQQPGYLFIEALSEGSYFEFEKTALEDYFDRYPAYQKLGRIIAEKAYLKMVQRMVNFQTLPLKERYDHLIEQHPKLFQLVPQKHIASYLGVTQQSLSRIKAERD